MKNYKKVVFLLVISLMVCGCTETTPESILHAESTSENALAVITQVSESDRITTATSIEPATATATISATETVETSEAVVATDRDFYAEYLGEEIEFSEDEIELLKHLTEESICEDNYCYNFSEMPRSEIEALGKLGFMCEYSLSNGEKVNVVISQSGAYILKNGERYFFGIDLDLFFMENLEAKITEEIRLKDIIGEEAAFIYSSNYTAPSNDLMKYNLSDERADGICAILSANMGKSCDIEVDASFEIHPVEFRFYFDHLFEGEYDYVKLMTNDNSFYFSLTAAENTKYYEISEQVWTDLSSYLDNCAPKEVYGTISEIIDDYIVVTLEDREVESVTTISSRTFSVGDRVRIRYSGYLDKGFDSISVDYARAGDEDTSAASDSELSAVEFEAMYDGETLSLSEEDKKAIYVLAEESVASFLGSSAFGLWGQEGYNATLFYAMIDYEDGHMMYVESSDSVREVTGIAFEVYSENTYIVCFYTDDMEIFELPERYAKCIREIAEKYIN